MRSRAPKQHRAKYLGAYYVGGSKVRVVTAITEGLASVVGKRVWIDLDPDKAEALALRIIHQAAEARARGVRI